MSEIKWTDQFSNLVEQVGELPVTILASAKPKKPKKDVGELSSAPTAHYQNFFNKFSEINSLPIKQWKTVHVVAYFCKRYEEQFGLKYTFKFNAVPSKCYEVFQINKIAGMLSSDPEVLKEYIDFVFDNKLSSSKKKVIVIGFVAHIDFVNEFKVQYLKSKEITRSTPINSAIREMLHSMNIINVETYGQLSFLLQAMNEDGDANANDNPLVIKLKEAGLNLESLERLK